MRVLALLLAFSLNAAAEDFTYDPSSGSAIPKHIGELKVLRGSAFKTQQNQEIPVKPGAKIYKGDVLTTAERSFVQVLVVDDTKINLGPNSSLKFDDFIFKGKQERDVVYQFLQGQMRALVKKSEKKDSLIRFKTSIATMGVRGTELLINHRATPGAQVSQFALLSGQVDVTDQKGEVFKLERLQSVTVSEQGSGESRTTRAALEALETKLVGDDTQFLPWPETQAEEHSRSSPTSQGASEASGVSPEASAARSRLKPAPGSFDNLQKLNEQLKEDHQKRSGQ